MKYIFKNLLFSFFIVLFIFLTFTFSANATISSEFPDLELGTQNHFVKNLQKFLNLNSFEVVSTKGQPGSIGYETEYFGLATQKALSKFQNKYDVSPSNGFFGKKTKEKIDNLIKQNQVKDFVEDYPKKEKLSGSNIIFSPSFCPVERDLNKHIQNEIDSRIDGVVSSSSTKSIWSKVGNGTSPWIRNADVWTNKGNKPIDWTGMSPWNSSGYYVYGGTLITPRHIVFANHWQIPLGSKVIFVDSSNNIVVRTLINSKNSESDIQIGLLDSDVPSSITYYPVIPIDDLNSHLSTAIGLPLVYFDQEDHALINEIDAWAGTLINHNPSKNEKRLKFSEELIDGDSGNPGFIIIDGKPILVLTHYFPGSGPNFSNFYDKINKDLDLLGGGYNLSPYSLDCFDHKDYSITVSAEGSGSGNFEGIKKGYESINTQRYSSGEEVIIKPVPDSGSIFFEWKGSCSGSSECRMIMNENKSITAVFKKEKPVIIYPSNNQIIPASSKVNISWMPVAKGTINNFVTEIQDITINGPVIQNKLQKGTGATFDVIPGHTYKFSIQSGLLSFNGKISEKSEITFTVSSDQNVENDSDLDGVVDSLDNCQNTNKDSNVNNKGCPIPIVSNFDVKPDFSDKDLSRIKNFSIGKSGIGKIDWGNSEIDLQKINGSKKESIDLDSAVVFKKLNGVPVVSVDSSKVSELDKPATITVEGLNFSKTPKIKRDGVICDSSGNSGCKIISYSNGTLVFTVQGFSEYTFEEDTTATPSVSSSGGGGGGGGGGGSSSSKLNNPSNTNNVNSSKVQVSCIPSSTKVGLNNPISIDTSVKNIYSEYTFRWSGSLSKIIGFDKTKEDQVVSFSKKGTYKISLEVKDKKGKKTKVKCAPIKVDKKYNTDVSSVLNPSFVNQQLNVSGKLNKDLSLGQNSNDVLILQKFLNSNGFIITQKGPGSPGNETVYFGELTKKAVKEFQKKKKITADGIVNEKTRTAINKLLE